MPADPLSREELDDARRAYVGALHVLHDHMTEESRQKALMRGPIQIAHEQWLAQGDLLRRVADIKLLTLQEVAVRYDAEERRRQRQTDEALAKANHELAVAQSATSRAALAISKTAMAATVVLGLLQVILRLLGK